MNKTQKRKKRKKTKEVHLIAKRRARYKKVMSDFNTPDGFELVLNELCKLNTKYLQQLLSDLKTYGYIKPWSGDYHRMLIQCIESNILERTMLK